MIKSKQDELVELLTEMIKHIEKITPKEKKEGFFEKVSNIVLLIVLTAFGSAIAYNFGSAADTDKWRVSVDAKLNYQYLTKENTEKLFISKALYYQVEVDEHAILRELFANNTTAMQEYIFGNRDKLGAIDANMKKHFTFNYTSEQDGK